MKRLIMGLAALGLANCATLSEEQCLAGNWRAVGYQDGAQGHRPDRVGQHHEACARHGVTPNLDAWNVGYYEGLETYCTVDNGLRVGARGGSYGGVCTGPKGQGFLAAYNDGRLFYEANHRAEQARNDVRESEQRMRDIRYELHEERQRSRDSELTQEQRDEALHRIEYLSRELGREESRHDSASYDIHGLEREAEDIRRFLYSRYPGIGGW